ncbi:MAG: geranylgeranylglyceryl/heptaprenylglyceryl phosphate synthase [Thermoplasmata archaeon]
MKILEEILEKLKKEKLHMTLIDPDSKDPEKCADIAYEAERAGTDYIMVGGSTGIDEELMDTTVKKMRSRIKKKIIIFPGSSRMISRSADAIFYMTLLNSKNPEYIVGHQVSAAKFLMEAGIETIPMAYIIFSPGMTAGRVGEAKLVDRADSEKALSYAAAAKLFGFPLIYFESGSGSSTYVSEETISYVKAKVKIPLIVGGGIRNSTSATRLAAAGADIIVTGSIAEQSNDIYRDLSDIIGGIKRIKPNIDYINS